MPRQMPRQMNIPRQQEMNEPPRQYFNIGTQNQNEGINQVREMRPPVGVDDIINELDIDIDSKNIDLDSISSSTGSRNVRSRIRKKRNSGGISLDLS